MTAIITLTYVHEADAHRAETRAALLDTARSAERLAHELDSQLSAFPQATNAMSDEAVLYRDADKAVSLVWQISDLIRKAANAL